MSDWEVESWDSEKPNKNKDENGNVKINDKLLKIYVNKTTSVIKNIKKIGLPKENEQLRLISTNEFNAVSFIKLIAEEEGIISCKLVIFAINQYAAKILIDLKNKGLIKNVTLIISSLRDGNKTTCKSVAMLKEYFDIYFLITHAKISVLQTKENYYNIEGSGNFSFNARIEQYVIDNSEQMFNFSNEWIDVLINHKSAKHFKLNNLS